MLRALIDSPTFMTWGSLFLRVLGIGAALTFVVSRFGPDEASVWMLFSSVAGIQLLLDAGLSPTFVRVIAYAMGGADTGRLRDVRSDARPQSQGLPDWTAFERIVATMKMIYRRMAFGSFAVMAVAGSLLLHRPIGRIGDPVSAWAAWGVVCVSSAVILYGNVYGNYLQGINKIALLRRWEILTAFFSIASMVGVILLNGGLLAVVAAAQVWLVAGVLRNLWLCRRLDRQRGGRPEERFPDRAVFEAVWPSAWRSGVGILMSQGVFHMTGLWFAQVGGSAEVASYLLGMKAMQLLTAFSMAPFYTKLPSLARLWSEGRTADQVLLARRGMRAAHWVYVAGFVAIMLLQKPLLTAVHSSVEFVGPVVWGVMGVAFFVERYGAMHIQLYSVTNHIVWHIANGVTGVLIILFTAFLFPLIRGAAFPVGVLLGYAGFYSWYSAGRSYRAFGQNMWDFEKTTSLPPFAVLAAAAGAMVAAGSVR